MPRLGLAPALALSALTGCFADSLPLDSAAPAPDAGPAADAGGAAAAPGDAGEAPPSLRFSPCGQVGFAAVVRAVPSPDGALIAVATRAQEVVLLSAADGSITRRLAAHAGAVIDAAFSEDGRALYSWGEDGRVRAWRVADGALLWAVQRGLGQPDVRLAVRGARVALGGPPGVVLDAADGTELLRFEHPALGRATGDEPGLVAISPDGSRMIAAQGATAYELDADGQLTGRSFSGDLGVVDGGAYTPQIQALQYSPDGSALLVAVRRAYFASVAERYPVARLYRVSDGSTIATLTASTSYGVSAALAPDGDHVAVAAGGAVRWWTVRDGSGWLGERSHSVPTGLRARELRVDRAGRMVGNYSGTGVLIQASDQPEPEVQAYAGDGTATMLRFLPGGGELLRSTGVPTRLELWSLGPEPTRIRAVQGSRVADLSPDGTTLAVAVEDGVELRSLDGGAVRRVASGLLLSRALAFAPDGRSLVVAAAVPRGASASPMSQWSLEGALLAEGVATGPVDQLRRTVSGEGWLAIAPSRDGHRGPMGVDLWSADGALTPRLRFPIEGAGRDSADLSADGEVLLAAGWLSDLVALRVADASVLPLSPPMRMARVAYSPDGTLLALAPAYQGLIIAEPAHPDRGTALAPRCTERDCVLPGGEATSLAFSDDSRTLAVASSMGDTRLFCRADP